MNPLRYFFILVFLAGNISLLHAEDPAENMDTWTVRGKLKVRHIMDQWEDLNGFSSPLAGVEIKVYARAKNFTGWGTWNAWPKVRTRSDGSFSISRNRGGDRRQFKVKILFNSERLLIKEGQETSLSFDGDGFPIDVNIDLSDKDWHEVFNDKTSNTERKAGVVDLGDITLRTTLLRQHGDLWYTYNKIFDKFGSWGGDYGFRGKVRIKYPMGIGNNASGTASYANPVNHTIYLKGSDYSMSTAIHELMHIWMYRHCSGENNMAWQLAKHQDTHQSRENTTFVPFHEGFAKWCEDKILREITNGRIQKFSSSSKTHAPYSRQAIRSIENIAENVDYTERGWVSLFNILTYKALGKVDFNVSDLRANRGGLGCPQGDIGLSFRQVLGTFLKNNGAGYSNYMRKNDMNFDDYLDRVAAIRNFNATRVARIKIYLDPMATQNPRNLYCSSAQPIRKPTGTLGPRTLKPKKNE